MVVGGALAMELGDEMSMVVVGGASVWEVPVCEGESFGRLLRGRFSWRLSRTLLFLLSSRHRLWMNTLTVDFEISGLCSWLY